VVALVGEEAGVVDRPKIQEEAVAEVVEAVH
jgi:hypothetical protein